MSDRKRTIFRRHREGRESAKDSVPGFVNLLIVPGSHGGLDSCDVVTDLRFTLILV